jgi:hypothetical protein
MNHVNPIESVLLSTPSYPFSRVLSSRVTQKVVAGVYQGVTTVELDVCPHDASFPVTRSTSFQNLAAETAAYLTTKHPDYAILAARIAISNLHKETKKNFSQVIKDLYEYSSFFLRCTKRFR